MSGAFLTVTTRFIKFSIFILFIIPSSICSIYIIYKFIKIPSFRRQFQNQTLVILIFIILLNIIFNIPTTLIFFAQGYVLSETKFFCLMWQSIDYIFTAYIIWCQAIFTLERYILIFNPNCLRSSRQKLFFHYIPLITIKLHLILFYIINIFNDNCKHDIEFHTILCGNQCIDQEPRLLFFNWLFNILFPAFIIIFGSIFLLIRVLWTRQAMQRNLRNWSKNRKMSIQLLGIAIFYTIVWLPLAIVAIILMFRKDHLVVKEIEEHLYFLTYLYEMSVPIVALLLWPELMPKLHRRVRPTGTVSIAIGSHSTH